MLLMVVLASILECMARIKIVVNHLITHDHNPNGVCSKMSCHQSERMLHRSPSLAPVVRGRGLGHGHGRDVNPIPFNLEEEVPPMEEQPLGDPHIQEALGDA